MGIFANCLEDLAIVNDVLSDYDSRDPSSRPVPRPSLTKIITEPPPIEPKFVWLGLEYLDNLDNAVKDGFFQIKGTFGR